jgi:hypothetical protein
MNTESLQKSDEQANEYEAPAENARNQLKKLINTDLLQKPDEQSYKCGSLSEPMQISAEP